MGGGGEEKRVLATSLEPARRKGGGSSLRPARRGKVKVHFAESEAVQSVKELERGPST